MSHEGGFTHDERVAPCPDPVVDVEESQYVGQSCGRLSMNQSHKLKHVIGLRPRRMVVDGVDIVRHHHTAQVSRLPV